MSIKETLVEYPDQPGRQFPVVFTDEFTETNLGLFSYSDKLNSFEEYLFVAYFSDKVNDGIWYFGKARFHPEFIRGVQKETGHDEEKVAGQFAVYKRFRGMVFTQLLLRTIPSLKDAENKKILRNLVEKINPDYLEDEIIFVSPLDPDMTKWGYYYSKENQLLENVGENTKRLTEIRKALGR